jgi:glycolate oxidase FAD binding subunit
MTVPLAPSSIPELVEAVRSIPRLIPVGARTKPRLSAVEAAQVSLEGLQGIIEYEPSEFTFTALAGTRVTEIAEALRKRGQYLPFDPMWQEAGATLGGTVASGLSGPGRFRFGGLRDFILGVRFVDGTGRLLRMGGKVVKNAAGFDLPKFLVGSLGRFGVLAEITFKVFPQRLAARTVKLEVDGPEAAAAIVLRAASSRWEPDALDCLPDGKTVCLRLAGPTEAVEAISREILSRWNGQMLAEAEAEKIWSDLGEFRWAASGPLIKVAITPTVWTKFDPAIRALDGTRIHVSAGGNVAFVSLTEGTAFSRLDEALQKLGLCGLTLRGEAPLWSGARSQTKITSAVKEALDPQNRFPSLEE